MGSAKQLRGRRTVESGTAAFCLLLSTNLCGALRPHPQESLQAYLDSFMSSERGVVIVLNPKTGEIRAAWRLQAGIHDAYPPGSTAKIVESAAALEEGLLSPSEDIFCRGVPALLGSSYRCVHDPAADAFNLSSALANSCNYFFVALSLRLSPEALAHWYSVFGFGSAVEVDAKSTSAGRVSVPLDARGKALAAIGEQNVLATPAQVLLAYSLIATGGEAFGLWTRRSSGDSPTPLRRIRFKRSTIDALTGGLVECVQSGTCQTAAVPGIRVAGKTGTATALDGSGATHAWFVGFAPAGDPEVALVVFLERGTGAHSAAPLAGEILRHYFAAKGREKTPR